MSETLDIPRSHIALLFEVGQSFTALADPEELVATVLARTRELFNADGCSIILLDESTNEFYFPFVANDPEGGESLRGLRFPADQGIAGWVVRTGTPLHVPDVSQDSRHYAGVDAKSGVATRSLLCAPLQSRSGTLGVIEVINRRDGQSFADSDLQILAALSGSVAIALENAHLYHRLKLSEARLREQVVALERERVSGERFPEIIGHGPAIEKVFRLMESACSSPISVLIEGETGTGKELIARAIHARSERRDQPFVAVNCGALQETLLESELFGHRKGSFTGAMSDKRGLFSVANNGTIFLDEIGETVPAMQVKLLRVLQSGEFLPVGGTTPERVDVRVICATNRTLMEEVRGGRFREDLYYRLSAFPIGVPPLRQRTEDIPLLVGHFLAQLGDKWKKRVRGTNESALALLTRYHWPGNVRELENEMARALTLAGDEEVLQPHHLSARIAGDVAVTEQKPRGTLKQARAQFEREYIAAVLAGHHHNVSHSAKALGISRVALQKKMKEYRLRDARPNSAPRAEE